MSAIKELVGCPKCGCVILPDAVKCPNCGTAYIENDSIDYSSKSKMKKVGIETVIAYYQFICPQHGKINVKATVTPPTLRCPFC